MEPRQHLLALLRQGFSRIMRRRGTNEAGDESCTMYHSVLNIYCRYNRGLAHRGQKTCCQMLR